MLSKRKGGVHIILCLQGIANLTNDKKHKKEWILSFRDSATVVVQLNTIVFCDASTKILVPRFSKPMIKQNQS